jgi:hypothetical protein
VEVSAQPLVATEALAAVVREHQRTLVLTARGDLVADDTLSYENEGIDWLAWPPTGRAVFLATDGKAERVMRAADGAGEVLVPLRVGSHEVHLQSMSNASIGDFAGFMTVPTPTHVLATSRATLKLGLPASVHPIAVLGGDHPWLAFGTNDALALFASIAIALLALRGRVRRVLGSVALGGLWLVSPFAWGALVGSGLVVLAAWAAARLLPPGPRLVAWGALALVAFVFGIAATTRQDASRSVATTTLVQDRVTTVAPAAAPTAGDSKPKDADESVNGWSEVPPKYADQLDQRVAGRLGQENSRLVTDGGIVQGVAPVALPLPAYERSVIVTRELVTRDRPLTLGLFYVTSTGLAPLFAVWLACIAWLGRLHGSDIARLVRSLRERLARQPAADPPTPAAPPPVVA